MAWPWVKRSRLEGRRRTIRLLRAQLVETKAEVLRLEGETKAARELELRATAAEAQATVLREELQRCQLERADLQLKLLRVGFGINPFVEHFTQTSVLPEEPSENAVPIAANLHPNASAEEVQATFTREAIELYGTNSLRRVQAHVERRQQEYYAGRQRPAMVSAEELAVANAFADEIQQAIAEGRASA